MTERQGGSDVRANITRAEPARRRRCTSSTATSGSAPIRRATCSWCSPRPGRASRASSSSAAPGWSSSDSRTSSGRGRCPPPRSSSAASSGRLVGEEGRGVPAIIRMVNHTRLDCLLGSARPDCAGERSRRSIMLATGPRSARCSSTSRRCATCSPTWRSSPRRRPRPRSASRALRRPRGRGVPPIRDRGDEVLGLQARGAPRCRGARVPRRQRLRRGLGPAAAVSRRAAELDLGGVGQRRGARRAAGDRSRTRTGCRRSWPSASLPAGADRAARRTPAAGVARRRAAEANSSASDERQFRARRIGRGPGGGAAGLAARPHAPPAVADAFCAARLGRRGGRVYGTLPPGVDAGRDRRPRATGVSTVDAPPMTVTPPHPRAVAGRRARADRRGRLRRDLGARDRRACRRRRGNAVPPFRLQGGPVRGDVPRRLRPLRSARCWPRKRDSAGSAADRRRRADASATFAQRALRNRRLAWALLAEPVDPRVDAERLAYRAR